jgi:hypothetical protein
MGALTFALVSYLSEDALASNFSRSAFPLMDLACARISDGVNQNRLACRWLCNLAWSL